MLAAAAVIILWPAFVACVAHMVNTIADAADAVGVSDRVIRRAIDKGDLSVRYPTSRPIILADELRDWLATRPAVPPSKAPA